MSPTVFREAGFRFFFYSREESRIHVHVERAGGSAKIWVEPSVELALSDGLSSREVGRALELARERQDEIRAAWQRHFGS